MEAGQLTEKSARRKWSHLVNESRHTSVVRYADDHLWLVCNCMNSTYSTWFGNLRKLASTLSSDCANCLIGELTFVSVSWHVGELTVNHHNYSAAVWEQSHEHVSESVCLYAISQKLRIQNFKLRQFSGKFPVAIAPFSSHSVVARYFLPVLWVMSCFPIIGLWLCDVSRSA